MISQPDDRRPPPSPEEQLRFLDQIQRLLSSGQFTATYKFALLHAIADLCVRQGTEGSGSPLVLEIADLTDCFVELYQRQAIPYPAKDGPRIFKQNTGRQARVLTVLSEPADGWGKQGTQRSVSRRAKTAINETIRDQPLWKLQTLSGGDRLNFLYENKDLYAVKRIELRPGIAYCFRAFYDLITAMVKDRWEQWIRRHNLGLLEEATDLQEFLFGSERQGLSAYGEILAQVQGRHCFYTGRKLRGDAAVDHFIPWSRYPVDLGHNFVLASSSANSQKADHLASEGHLESWLDFCLSNRKLLRESFDGKGLPHSLEVSLAVTEWSYARVESSGGRVWVGGKEFAELSVGWRDLIESARKELAAA